MLDPHLDRLVWRGWSNALRIDATSAARRSGGWASDVNRGWIHDG